MSRWTAAVAVIAVGALAFGVAQVVPASSRTTGASASTLAGALTVPTHRQVISDAAGDAVIDDRPALNVVTVSTTNRGYFWVSKKSPYSNIKALQYLLLAWGYYTPTTGRYDAATVASVKKFQRRKHLAVDGLAGPITMAAITPQTYYRAKNRNTVKAIQQLLVKFGYRLAVDGSFGPQTRADVIHFEKSHRLISNGIVGPQTWSWLFNPATRSAPKPTPKPKPAPSGNCSAVHAGVTKSHTVIAANGIRVNKCLAARVKAMVAAAKRSGVTLRANSSWRDPAFQIRLRRQNCGTSHYAIYVMPSTSCSPATAIPGTSRHERGLAIDFANSGRGSRVFNWLTRNASRYGLQNLKLTGSHAEPWHWSVDGH